MSSGVEFEEDKLKYTMRPSGSGASGSFGGGNEPRMVRWLMKKGFAKSPIAAQIILVGVIIINIIITYVVITHYL